VRTESKPFVTELTSSEFLPVRDRLLEREMDALTLLTHSPMPPSNVESAVESRFGPVIDEVPAGVVTLTPTVPEPVGATAVIEASLSTVNEPALAEPNLTAVAPVKPPPVIVTLVPAFP
jgi:hypothetical protein